MPVNVGELCERFIAPPYLSGNGPLPPGAVFSTLILLTVTLGFSLASDQGKRSIACLKREALGTANEQPPI